LKGYNFHYKGNIYRIKLYIFFHLKKDHAMKIVPNWLVTNITFRTNWPAPITGTDTHWLEITTEHSVRCVLSLGQTMLNL